MKLKDLIEEDIVNYKVPSMLLAFNSCTFKCDRENGQQICQNSLLTKSLDIEISIEEIVNKYINNNLTSAICMSGLEPMDSFNDVLSLISNFRLHTQDTIIIYTGYYKNEILDKVILLQQFPNIIIKFGRFIPGEIKHYDDVLGIYLASNNQYAERIS